MADETVILRIQLDPSQEIKKMEQLTLELETNRKAQKELNEMRRLQTITDVEYSKRQVELKGTISALQREYNVAGKNLTAYQNLTEQAEGSVDQLKAQLALLTSQYNSLSAAERENSDAGRELQAQALSVNEQLKAAGAGIGDFRRNVGDYANQLKGSFESLVQQLVKLEAQEKSLAAGSKELLANQQQQIGFRTAAVQAAAKEGESYEEVTNKLQSYSAAIRPAVEALTQLEAEQARVVESGEETTEAYRQIGFQIAQTKKQIESVPTELPEIKVPTGSLKQLTDELVKIRVQQRGLAEDSGAYKELERKATAYAVSVQAAAAKTGASYEEAQKQVGEYSASIEPLIEALVELEEQQAKVAEGSEEYNRIGFQIEAARKSIEDAVPTTQSFGQALLEAAGETDTLGGAVQRAAGFQEKYAQAQNLVKLAMGSATGAAGVLRVAMLAIPIFAVIAALTVLYSFFTRTQEGADFAARKMAALSAVMDKLANIAADAGKALFDAANNPKQAFSDLVDFLETNLLNRLKSFGVIVDGILNLDAGKIADGFIQAGTGITDATSKAKAFGQELANAANAAEQLAQREKNLERATNDNIDTNKRLLNDVERLKNIRDNEFNSLAVRRKANEDAFKVEMQREGQLVKLAQERVAILRDRLQLEGGRSRNEALFKELKEAQNELVDIQEDAAGKQNELITNRYQLAKEGLDKEKELAEKNAAAAEKRAAKALQARREALQLDLLNLDTQLRATQEGSDKELAILQQKLNKQRQLELAVKDLTNGQKRLIDAKYEADSDKLLEETIRKRAQVALNVEAQAIAVRLNAVRQGSEAELKLQQEAVEKQRQVQLAAISERANADERAQQERLINSNAERQQNDLLYADRLKAVQTFYQQERNLLEEARAGGLVTEQQYQELLFQQELGQVAAKREVNKSFNKDTAADDQALTDLKIANLKRVTDAERQQAQERADITQTLAVLVGQFFAESVNGAGQALEDFARKALLILVESVEKSIIAAQAKILVEAFSSPDSIASFGATGFLRAAAIIAAVTAATAPLKAALTSGGAAFAEGGPVYGPGGPTEDRIPAWLSNGEFVMTAAATKMFGPTLSAMNHSVGGRGFASPQVPRYALGGIANPYIREGLAGPQAAIDYAALGKEVARALQVNPPITRIADVKSGLNRSDFTDSMANS